MSSKNSVKAKYQSADECMQDSDENIRLAALEAKMGYVTLNTKTNKLSLCKELSLHEQPMFSSTGRVNPMLKKALKAQEKECGACKA